MDAVVHKSWLEGPAVVVGLLLLAGWSAVTDGFQGPRHGSNPARKVRGDIVVFTRILDEIE